MKTASLKAKGRRLQNLVCEALANLINASYGKDEDISPREMGQTGPDCRFSKRVRDLLKISVECKNQERWNIHKFVEQVKKEAYPDTNWVLVLSRNRQKQPYVVIEFYFFLELLKGWLNGREK